MQTDAWDHLQARLASAVKSSSLSPMPSVLDHNVRKVGGHKSIRTDVEMTQFLDALLVSVFAEHSRNFERLSGPTGAHHKWRYSSAFQKAVRRNDPSIYTVAAALNECDPKYIWRRAPTIALEEVSLGDPWVCALVLHACRFARVRRHYGFDELAGFLGELMGSAVKDRSSCDSYCLPYFHPKLADVRTAVEEMPVAERAELYRSEHTPFSVRVAAGMALSGPRYGGDVFVGDGGSQDLLAEAVQGLVPYPIQWLSRQYSKMARDGMFVTLPLVWGQLMSEGQTEIAQNQLPPRVLIDGLLSATFDGHTQEGRRALADFAGSCMPVQRLLKFEKLPAQALALAVFTVDSSQLDRSLTSPWAQALYEENLRGELLAAGSSPKQFMQLSSAVSENLHALNEVRQRVCRKARS